MKNNYKVITLCGSTRFKNEFFAAQKALTLGGNIVISVGVFGHDPDLTKEEQQYIENNKQMLDDMHKRKIDMADAIMIISPNGYVGKSTKSEIEYAKAHNKEVLYWEQ